ncbi:MAG: hypothetical protein WA709_36135 [Stellaceae bacterium]
MALRRRHSLAVHAAVKVTPAEPSHRTPGNGDLTIAVIDAQFSKSGDACDFWTERLDTRDEQILLTWYELGDPLLVHTQPNSTPGRPYGMCTVLIPALGARLTRNGIEAEGRPWPRNREGHPSSTCVLGLCESWTQAR